MDRNICRPNKTVITVTEDEVSKQVDGENSRGIIDRIISVCNPNDSLFCHFDIPNTKILIAGVARAEDWPSLMDWSAVKVSREVQNGKKRMIRMKDNHFFSIHVCFSDYLFTGIKTKKKKKKLLVGKNILIFGLIED